jgi:hypothetical protein
MTAGLIGVSLGLMVGLPTSAILVSLIRQLGTLSGGSIKLHWIIGQALALPTFWVGGPWATGQLVQVVRLADIVPFYFPSCVVTLVVVAGPSLFVLAYRPPKPSYPSQRTRPKRPPES